MHPSVNVSEYHYWIIKFMISEIIISYSDVVTNFIIKSDSGLQNNIENSLKFVWT